MAVYVDGYLLPLCCLLHAYHRKTKTFNFLPRLRLLGWPLVNTVDYGGIRNFKNNNLERPVPMARRARSGSGKALDSSLQPFLLDGIVETGEEIGKGAYGSVRKVRRWGTLCAAKKLHELPLQLVGKDVNESTLAKFERECHLMSSLRHPYIVQFLGVYIERGNGSGLPVIVMEYLPTSLAACVQSHPQIPLFLQVSMLHNVALGLAYLHGHSPPIIHRDLTANNVLLTSNMVAKIADLGVARILDLSPRTSMCLTQAPGTAAYMPPEALAANPNYNTKIDSFAFGVLTIHLVSQQWPIPSEATRVDGGKLVPVSEAARRQQYLDLMGQDHCLLPLALQCLQNDSKIRPEIPKLVSTLEALQKKHPVPTITYLDLLQASLLSKVPRESLTRPSPSFFV